MEVDSSCVDQEGDVPQYKLMLISKLGKDYRVTVDVSLKALRKMVFLDEPFLTRILFIL